MKATATVYQDTRRQKKNGTYPIKLRVTLNRVSRYYGIGISLTIDEFKRSYLQDRPRGNMKDLKLKLFAIESKAVEIIEDMEHFDFNQFRRRFSTKRKDFTNLVYHVREREKYMRSNQSISTADLYKQTADNLDKFTSEKGVDVRDLTIAFLSKLEAWMLSQGKSITTVSMHMRCIRATYNIIKEDLNIPPSAYPFGERKYQIPKVRNVKKALSSEDLKKLMEVPSDIAQQEKARDFFFLSMFCQGANLHDLLHAKHSQLEGDVLTFDRAKSINKKKRGALATRIMLPEQALEIIDKYKTATKPNEYIFTILQGTQDVVERKRKVKAFTRYVNQHLKKLAKKAGVTEKVSMNWARHSFATLAKRKGASIEFISESLGHSDIRTTQIYLDSFEDNAKREMNKKIFDI